MIKILKNKKYTLHEIIRDGLLLSQEQKPIKTPKSIRLKLTKAGYLKPTGRGKYGKQYEIDGKDIIKLNNICKKL